MLLFLLLVLSLASVCKSSSFDEFQENCEKHYSPKVQGLGFGGTEAKRGETPW